MASSSSPRASGLTGRGPTPRVLNGTTSFNTNSTTTVIAAPTNSKQIVILSFDIGSEATATGLYQLKNGAGGTVMWQTQMPANPAPVSVNPVTGGELFRCNTNTLLQIVGNASNTTGYINVRYLYEDP